jgi:hypothetical protein
MRIRKWMAATTVAFLAAVTGLLAVPVVSGGVNMGTQYTDTGEGQQ